MQSSATFWDNAARKYAQTPISDEKGYRRTLTRTLGHLTAQDRVLELGCGTASTALEIAPHVAHVTATDISAEMIGIAREKLAVTSQDNVTLRVSDADDPALEADGPYDAILAMNLLHLMQDHRATLTRARGLLKPDGLLITKTACLGDSWYFRPMVRVMQWLGKAPHVLQLRGVDLRRDIETAGFEIVEELKQSGVGNRFYFVARRTGSGFDTAQAAS